MPWAPIVMKRSAFKAMFKSELWLKPETEQQSEPWEAQRILGSMRIMIMKPFNVFHDPHRKGRSSPSGVSLTLDYLEGGGGGTRDNIECGNQASPKPSPIRGVKSPPIESLLGVEGDEGQSPIMYPIC